MTSFRLSGTLLAVAALLCVAGTSASASASVTASVTAEPRPSAFKLVVQGPSDGVHAVHLRCDPPGGSHPGPFPACAELAEVDGDFAQLEKGPVACTMELRPVTARAHGVWRGKLVHWQEQFSNPCVLRAATGTVFDF